LNDDVAYSQNVIDRMLLYYKNNFFTQINNYNNFNHFAGLLNTILFNIDRKKEYLDINFAIIYIAEKTFFKNKENPYNKIYLCSLISKNKIYSDKKFWCDLIELKLGSVIENKLPLEMKKKENELIAKQNKSNQELMLQNKHENRLIEEENSKNILNSNNHHINCATTMSSNESDSLSHNNSEKSITTPTSSGNTQRKTSSGSNSLMNLFGNKVKNFFSNNNSENVKNLNHSINGDPKKSNKKLDTSMLINKDEVLEALRKNEVAVIIKEFLTHFSNFNFDVTEANDLIDECSVKYHYEKDKVSLFIIILNSNMFTIKNKSGKIALIDNSKKELEKAFKKFLNLNDNKLIIHAFSLKYLNLTEYPSLMMINKNYNKKLSKIIFSNVLLYNQMIMKTNKINKLENQKKIRLGIWIISLNIVNNDLIAF